MMDLNLFAGVATATSKLVTSVGDAIDKNVTSDEERLTLKNQLETIFSDLEKTLQEQTTIRQQADMTSDSWLSKNIRPMVLIAIVAIYTLFAVLDGLGVVVFRETFANGIIEIGMTVFSFYFGGRTIEKASFSFRKKG